MYVCICARVRECELRAAIQAGARTRSAVAQACGAGTGCGSCRHRVGDLLRVEDELVLVEDDRALVEDGLVLARDDLVLVEESPTGTLVSSAG